MTSSPLSSVARQPSTSPASAARAPAAHRLCARANRLRAGDLDAPRKPADGALRLAAVVVGHTQVEQDERVVGPRRKIQAPAGCASRARFFACPSGEVS